ncbi:MAG: OB-fold nucleic acid binding domain-containing protein, partial [Chitinophagaceae bacterium]
MSESKLHTPIEFLKGVGPAKAALLKADLNIHTFEDLLGHYPYRYFDRSEILPINKITEDSEWVQLQGIITNIGEEGNGGKRRLLATLYDDTERIELLWFQGRAAMKRILKDGAKYVVFGKVSFFMGKANIPHPEVELLSAETNIVGRQPVYSSTQKLISRGITNRSFAKLTQALFQAIKPEDIPELLPQKILEHYHLLPRSAALAGIHFPQTDEELQR